MNTKSKLFCCFFALLVSFSAAAAEYSEGALRLVLDEETGRFSLYSLGETGRKKPLALFADQDPRTSFLSVAVNGRFYKMGDTSAFRIRTAGSGLTPSLVFESSFMSVTEEFSFVKNPGSTAANGVAVTITLENRGDRQISAGARVLIDTSLSERSGISFATNNRTINAETLLSKNDGDNFWTDRNDTVSLTGSLFTGSSGDPDSVHFANWKKLNDVSWEAPYQPGRNFNFPPYSVRDSAVCYYYENRLLSRGEKRTFSFILALGNDGGIDVPSTVLGDIAGRNSGAAIQDMPEEAAVSSPVFSASREQDLAAIKELLTRIDSLISSGAATEEELSRLEIDLNRLRAKYGPGTR